MKNETENTNPGENPTAPSYEQPPPPSYNANETSDEDHGTSRDAAEENIAKCGYLRRRKNIMFIKWWKLRWCVLFKNGSFVVFENENCLNVDIHMWLQQSCTNVRSGMGIVGIDPPQGFTSDCLIHATTNDEGDLYFSADDIDEAKAWEYALLEAKQVALPKPETYSQGQVRVRNPSGNSIFVVAPPLPIIVAGPGWRRWGPGFGFRRPRMGPHHYGMHHPIHHHGGFHGPGHHMGFGGHRGGMHGGFGGHGFGHHGGMHHGGMHGGFGGHHGGGHHGGMHGGHH